MLRTVRLTAEEEMLLERVCRQGKLTVSAGLKGGIRALHRELNPAAPAAFRDWYGQLDLGAGGYAIGPAKDAKHLVGEEIDRKRIRTAKGLV